MVGANLCNAKSSSSSASMIGRFPKTMWVMRGPRYTVAVFLLSNKSAGSLIAVALVTGSGLSWPYEKTIRAAVHIAYTTWGVDHRVPCLSPLLVSRRRALREWNKKGSRAPTTVARYLTQRPHSKMLAWSMITKRAADSITWAVWTWWWW